MSFYTLSDGDVILSEIPADAGGILCCCGV